MSEPAKMTVTRLQRKKRSGEKITLLTAYDFPMAKFINDAGVDMVLVSDAVGTVGLGRPEAVSVSVEEMIYHTQAVARGAGSAMVVTTLPFGVVRDRGTGCCHRGAADERRSRRWDPHGSDRRRCAQSEGAGSCRCAGDGSPGNHQAEDRAHRGDSDPGADGGQRSDGCGRRCSAGERGCLCADPGVYPRSAWARSSPAAWKFRRLGLGQGQGVTVRHW